MSEAEPARREEMLGRHVLGMAVFLVLLLAGLALVNHFEPCEHGREGFAAPCHDPSDDWPSC